MNDKTRRTIRTVLQVLLGLAVSLPVLLDATGLTPDQVPYLAVVVAACAVFARAMQSEPVEKLLERILGGQLATPGGTKTATVAVNIDTPGLDDESLRQALITALRRTGDPH